MDPMKKQTNERAASPQETVTRRRQLLPDEEFRRQASEPGFRSKMRTSLAG